MRSVQLTGIGNALVDVEFKISEEELQAFGVQKSTMQLTEPARQAEILKALADRTAVRSSGGSVANSIIAFAQFGGTAGFISILGNDSMGQFYASEFLDLGIVLTAKQMHGQDTGSCVVFITPDGERTMNTTLAANLNFNRTMLDEDVIKHSEWLLLEGYKLTEAGGAESLDVAAYTARKHGGRVAVSCSDTFIIDVFGDQLRSILKNADMIFCNEQEACKLADEETVHHAYQALKSRYGNVALTQGAAGSQVHWYGKEAAIPAYAVEMVDATGAGDMYAGAFLYGVLNGKSLEHSGWLASYCSAKVVGQYGARLKTNHIEVRDYVLKNAPVIG